MSETAPALVISDLHLEREPGPTLNAALAFLDGPARTASALYILGDLFEYWVGDDAPHPAAEQLAAALSALEAPVMFIHGNRDFLVGPDYAARAGMTLAPEPLHATLPCGPALLMHGDSLCTDDSEHMAFRQMVRSEAWQRDFLGQPLEQRIARAETMREASRHNGQMKAAAITDVNGEAVAATFRDGDVPLLIHGHTHRPAIHDLEIAGQPRQRCVLPAWDEHPGFLELGPEGPVLRQLDETPYPAHLLHA
ncbi:MULTISPECIES: UDP-2,3-diacylglucosamine diphosphatase [unclassified Thioalkalivibrio]|uniref:UDP-2,3-diacylglucosamine diphosphatase n=1 Tax=unclassified Thioalkalivibrio TaxID=2621013 RepID=UPI000374AB6F|nr:MULTISPECIES: UDP-2,3-diacylglucosamine diphosphatase [unclassified Thioalkalivibrio]PYG04316.1 UDP-2,3-diacylglucosamine hydrolase [Thioalkalivibrio sp. ALE21]